jgi:hypothetical protein
MTTLTFASAFIGTAPFTWVGDTRHYTRLYTVLVGASSRARKGTSRDPVERIFREAERLVHGRNTKPFPLGLQINITPGPLSSGEGLVYAVRDPSDALDKDGQPIDPGVEDKRLLVVDGEFGAALKGRSAGWQHPLGNPPVRVGPRQYRAPYQKQPHQGYGHAHQLRCAYHLGRAAQAAGVGGSLERIRQPHLVGRCAPISACTTPAPHPKGRLGQGGQKAQRSVDGCRSVRRNEL